MDNDFKEFLEGNQQIPQRLYNRTLEYTLHSLNPKKLLTKFYVSHFLGGLLTLFICPQYGYGPMSDSLHYIMSFGAIWCGIFCAGVFFVGANTLSMLLLSKTELEWIANHKVTVLGTWVTFLFFFGMLAKYYAPAEMHYSSASHYMSWYLSALAISFSFFTVWKLRLKTSEQS